MAGRFAVLQRIDNNGQITKENHSVFLSRLQSALLLALREQGRLSAMQLRQAQEGLQKQRRERAKKLSQKGEHP